MSKYIVHFTEEYWYQIEIEANSLEEAKDKFWAHYFDHAEIIYTGTEIQEIIDIEEV